eukprot:4033551-Pyramimonas_sp.AAC.1
MAALVLDAAMATCEGTSTSAALRGGLRGRRSYSDGSLGDTKNESAAHVILVGRRPNHHECWYERGCASHAGKPADSRARGS